MKNVILKNTTLIKKIENLIKENKEIENYNCIVAYDSPDFVVPTIKGINYNADFNCINFRFTEPFETKAIKVKELLKELRKYNKKDVEIIDVEYSNYILTELTPKQEKYNINNLYFVFKNRWEVQ